MYSRTAFGISGLIIFIIFIVWICSGGDDDPAKPPAPENLCQQKIGSSLQQYIKNNANILKLDDYSTDLEIAYDGGVVRAHKIILAAHSPYLDKLIWNRNQTNESRIDLPFLKSDITLDVLRYIYTSKIEFKSYEFGTSILQAADDLGLEALKCECSKYLSTMIDTKRVGDVLVVADKANATYLLTNASSYLFKHMDKTLTTPEWVAVTKDHRSIFATAIDYHGKMPSNGICEIECIPVSLQSAEVVAKLVEFFNTGRFADAEIQSNSGAGNYTFKVNKAILIGQSDEFQRQFQQSSNVILEGFDTMVVREFLLYMYSGRADQLEVYSAELCELAGKYRMSQLLLACEDTLITRLDVTNIVHTIRIASRLHSKNLAKATRDFLLKHKKDVVKTKEWADLKTNEPELIADIFQ